MKLFSKEGLEMMDMISVRREGDILVIKGKMMGAMTTSIYLKPKDAWQSISFLSWSILWYMPIILIKGFWENWRNKK